MILLLRYLTARQRSIVFTSVDQQLMHEPTVETRNRKQMRANPLASWELCLGDLRVYYDAALVPLDNMDYESIELANNPQFLAILAEARASYAREGGVSSEEVKKMFENDSVPGT